MNIKPPLHIIMHVPKTGGASIADGMKKTLGSDRVLRCDWFDQLLHHSKTKGLSNYDVIICHISRRELYYLADDFDLQISTFLREPVARVFSNYCFWRQYTPNVVLQTDKGQLPLVDLQLEWKEDLERILKRSNDIWKFRELVNVSTWQFSTSLYERAGRGSTQALIEAKRLLEEMIFIGFQDNLDIGYKSLVSKIDQHATVAPLEKHNRTKQKDDLVLDHEAHALITKHNTLDIELYNWAHESFPQSS